MNEKFLRPYSPKENEEAIYRRWEDSGFFNPDVCIEKGVTEKDAEPYSIVLPPPNVTGTLHMGHAAMLAIEDILVRFARMRGMRALWVPGTDHAAIATQSVVEKNLYKKEGKTRHDLGREAFLALVETSAKESHDTIVHQLKKMGASLDWSREAFTLDADRVRAVRTAFKRMYDDGLIERGLRVVNWDPKGQTVISDDEVVYEERPAKLYTFRYVANFPIAISTTRPETKVGDAAVAVHPDDPRYKTHVGRTFQVSFAGANLTIDVVADESVDPAYGTGAVGVTPAHSVIDSDIAERHGLGFTEVIDERAHMTKSAGSLVAGLKVKDAREKIVSWLKENKLLEKEEDIVQNIGTAERTGGVIEPLSKLQWFIKVNKKIPGRDATLKDTMREAVASGSIRIVPEHFEKTYFHWINNLRDWCISRQIWYGHRIPVWYCQSRKTAEGRRKATLRCNRPIVEVEDVKECPYCGGGVVQDSDTLDTWFSSGLWTFSTLGWPEKTADLKTYHPTSVLETGYDILFFWVARMILMSGYHLGEIPFRKVYLHGLVRDEKGRKMSKSLGNVIDPLNMVEKYGADATRLSLIMGAAPGNDLKLSEDRVRGYKHFANKIWNIARFVLENGGGAGGEAGAADRKLVAEAKTVAATVTEHIGKFRLDLAAGSAYHYVWDRFAAEVIEESKSILKGNDEAAKASRQAALYEILTISLKLLHPFMPFVTEEIWSHLPERDSELLMVARWPA